MSNHWIIFFACLAGCGGNSSSSDGGSGDGGCASNCPAAGPSVLQHHMNPSRDGVYTDSALSRAAAAGLHRDATFSAKVNGPTYAQPLFLDGKGGRDLLFVATEQNQVTAFDAAGGAV